MTYKTYRIVRVLEGDSLYDYRHEYHGLLFLSKVQYPSKVPVSAIGSVDGVLHFFADVILDEVIPN